MVTRADLLGVGVGSTVQVDTLATAIETEVDTDIATHSALAALGDTIYCMSGVAAAGSAITDATDLTANYGAVLVSTCATNQGVQLPVPAAGRRAVFILNACGNGSTGTTLKVYPPSSTTQINILGAGTADTLASGKSALYMAIDNSGNYMKLLGS